MIQCVGGALDLADNSLGAMQSDSQALIRTPTAGSCVDLNALQQSFPSSLVTDTIGTFVTSRTVGIVDTSRFAVSILAVLAVQVFRDVLYITNFIRCAVGVLRAFWLVTHVCIKITLW